MEGIESTDLEGKPKPLIVKTPKHNRLGALGAGILGLTLLGGGDHAKAFSPTSQDSPAITEQTQDIRKEIAEPIKDFIEIQGDNEVSFKDAQAIVPAIARLYNHSGSRLSQEEIAKSTYFTRNEDSVANLDFSDPELNPLYIHLKEDYPQATIDAQTMFTPSLYQILGFESQQQVVLFLGNINKRDYNYKFEFDSIQQTACDQSTPAVTILNTAIHEYGHQDVEGDWSNPIQLPLDGDIITHHENIIGNKTDKAGNVISGSKRGFALNFVYDTDTSAWFVGLDEWTTQYLANKTMMDYGLPALSVYGSGPKTVANFQAILEQSGISDQELKELRRTSSIEEFFIRIADGAEGVDFQSDAEKIAFSFDLFYKMMNPTEQTFVWEEPFKPYFQSVDLDFYKTHPPSFTGAPISCVVNNS